MTGDIKLLHWGKGRQPLVLVWFVVLIFRLLLILPAVYFVYQDLPLIAVIIILIALATDYADGAFYRRIIQIPGNIPRLWKYFDSIIDFIFITFVYFSLVRSGKFSVWIIPLLLFMFIQFLLTSEIKKKPIYDPIGRYYGIILYLVLIFIILVPTIKTYALFFILVITCITLASRIFYFLGHTKD